MDTQTDRGVFVTLRDLVALEGLARHIPLRSARPVRTLVAGRRTSTTRGRGLAFEEMRQYQPGDDVRTIDWRATARSGKPFVRVYDEEKDRPVFLVVDQRANMFFGTRRSMKSVSAAETAALFAWRALGEGDRVGGIVLDDDDMDTIRPTRERAGVMRLLQTIVMRNNALAAEPRALAPSRLGNALEAVSRLAHHDHLIVVISDFDGNGPRTHDLLTQLANSNNIVAALVYDPFLLDLPSSGAIVAGAQGRQAELRFGVSSVREGVSRFASDRRSTVLEWRAKLGVFVLPISAAEETAPQLVRLLHRQTIQGARSP
nr:DUF58 domain-containing protein [Aureimonas altamirensis]